MPRDGPSDMAINELEVIMKTIAGLGAVLLFLYCEHLVSPLQALERAPITKRPSCYPADQGEALERLFEPARLVDGPQEGS